MDATSRTIFFSQDDANVIFAEAFLPRQAGFVPLRYSNGADQQFPSANRRPNERLITHSWCVAAALNLESGLGRGWRRRLREFRASSFFRRFRRRLLQTIGICLQIRVGCRRLSGCILLIRGRTRSHG
jgi:hypothetical protein